ncbi:MAG: DUF456 family protein [Tepidisphaeraceae bacterium]|jgi:uncharacterized protein YqgC (DUF456 family)
MILWLYYFLLLILLLAGLLLVALTLPGLWFMATAAGGYAILTHERFLGWHTLIALLVLALAAEVLEMGLVAGAAKAAGGGRRGMIGGIVGAVLGGIFLSFIPIPIVGTILGICLGSFLGAAVAELAGGREAGHSLRIGFGAAKGRLLGIFSKLSFGLVMLMVILWTALPV